MALGNEIIVTAEPGGVFKEGPISGTPKPGTVMQIKAATAKVNGNFTWEVYNKASDGVNALIAVLLPDTLRGKVATAAYANGDHGFLYCPIPGEELNMLVADVSGTGDDHAIGDTMMVDDGTGKLVAASSADAEPFQLLEAATDPTADALMHAIFTGS